jgi:hypothetical protein
LVVEEIPDPVEALRDARVAAAKLAAEEAAKTPAQRFMDECIYRRRTGQPPINEFEHFGLGNKSDEDVAVITTQPLRL